MEVFVSSLSFSKMYFLIWDDQKCGVMYESMGVWDGIGKQSWLLDP